MFLNEVNTRYISVLWLIKIIIICLVNLHEGVCLYKDIMKRTGQDPLTLYNIILKLTISLLSETGCVTSRVHTRVF